MNFSEARSKLTVVIDADAKGAIKELDTLSGKVKQSNPDSAFSKFKSTVAGLRVPIAAASAAFAVQASIIKTTVGAYTSYAAKVREVQRVSGTTAKEASGLTYAFEKLGIGSTKGANALFQLEKRIGSGKTALADYGIATKRTSAGALDLVGTLGNIANAYRATNDPAKRAAIVMAAFGRQGKELIPILAGGREGIKALFDEAGRNNKLLDQGDLERAKQFTMATRELGQAFDGIKIKLGNAFTPALTQLTEASTSLVQIATQTKVFDALAAGAAAWGGSLTAPIKLLRQSTDLIGITEKQSSAAQAAKFAYDNYNKALNEYSDLASAGELKTKAGLAATERLAVAKKALTLVENGYLAASGQTQAAQEALTQKSDTYRAAIEGVNAVKEQARTGELNDIERAKQLASAYDQVTAAKQREAAAISGALDATFATDAATKTYTEDLAKLNDGTAQAVDNTKLAADAWALAKARTAEYGNVVTATTGHQLTAVETAKKQIQSLKDLAAQNPATAAAVQPLIDKLDYLVKNSAVKADINADVKGSEDVDTLDKRTKGLKGKNIKVTVDVEGTERVKRLGDRTKDVKGKKIKVEAEVEGSNRVDRLNDRTRAVKGKKVRVEADVEGTARVQRLGEQTQRVKGKDVRVRAEVDGADRVQRLGERTQAVRGKDVTVRADVEGTERVRRLSERVASLEGKQVSVRADVEGTARVQRLAERTEGLQSKSITVIANVDGGGRVQRLAERTERLRNKSIDIRAGVEGSGAVQRLLTRTEQLRSRQILAKAIVEGSELVKRLGDRTERLKSKEINVKANVSGIDQVRTLRDTVRDLRDKTITVTVRTVGRRNFDGSVDLDGNPLTPRALGGPVSARKTYLVGEDGPEIFVPSTSGRILNARQSLAQLNRVGGESYAPTYNVTVQSLVADENVGRLVVKAIQRHENIAGTRWRQN